MKKKNVFEQVATLVKIMYILLFKKKIVEGNFVKTHTQRFFFLLIEHFITC